MEFSSILNYTRLTDKWVVLEEDLHFHFCLSDVYKGANPYLREKCAITGLSPTETIHIVAPRGFVTDLASIPPMFRGLFKPDGEYAPAAVLHDMLYQFGANTLLDYGNSPIERLNAHGDKFLADKVFLLAMRVLGIDTITRNVLYNAVCIGGKSSYYDDDNVEDYGIIAKSNYAIGPLYEVFRPNKEIGVMKDLTDVSGKEAQYHRVKFRNLKRGFVYPTEGNTYPA